MALTETSPDLKADDRLYDVYCTISEAIGIKRKVSDLLVNTQNRPLSFKPGFHANRTLSFYHGVYPSPQ